MSGASYCAQMSLNSKMGRLIEIIVFMAFILLTGSQAAKISTEELIPQIKTTKLVVNYRRPDYHIDVHWNITKHNATYNNINLYWDIEHDVDPDIFLTVSAYVTDSEYKNEKFLINAVVPMCKEHPMRHLMPIFLILPDPIVGNCFKKGLYVFEDAGNFRFDLLVPNIQKYGNYFITKYETISKDKILTEFLMYSEWGYLNVE